MQTFVLTPSFHQLKNPTILNKFVDILIDVGPKVFSFTNAMVLPTPKCPPKPPLWISFTIFRCKKLPKMHKIWFLNKNLSFMWKSKYKVILILKGTLHAFQVSEKYASYSYNSFIHSKLKTLIYKVFNKIILWLNASWLFMSYNALWSINKNKSVNIK